MNHIPCETPGGASRETYFYLYPDGELVSGRVRFTAPGRVSMTDAAGTVHSNIPEALLMSSEPRLDQSPCHGSGR